MGTCGSKSSTSQAVEKIQIQEKQPPTEPKNASPLEAGIHLGIQAKEQKLQYNLGRARTLFEEAIGHLSQAVEGATGNNLVAAKNMLCKTYLDLGELLETVQDFKTALEVYQKALKLGDQSAQERLKSLASKMRSSTFIEPIPEGGDEILQPPASALSKPILNIPSAFTQNPDNPKLFLSESDLKGEPETTDQLVAAILKCSNKESPLYKDLNHLALGVISEFAREPIKKIDLIEEVLVLAKIEDASLLHEILDKFSSAFVLNSFLISTDLIEGLAKTISLANPALLRKNDLVKLLSILGEVVKETHQQFGSEENREVHAQLLRSLGKLLDAMSDAGVEGLNREIQHEPLYDALGIYLQAPSQLSYEAHYCRQALVRLPNDESKWKMYLRRSIGIGKGITALWTAVKNLDPSSLVDAYENLNSAVKHQEDAQGWYDELRYAALLIEIERFVEFEQYVKKNSKHLPQAFVYGVMIKLQKLMNEHSNLSCRLAAMNLLGQLFIFSEHWFTPVGLVDKIKNKALNSLIWKDRQEFLNEVAFILLDCTRHPEKAINEAAFKLLTQCQEEADADKFKIIKEKILLVGKLKPREAFSQIKPSKRLLAAAKKSSLHGASVEGKLARLRQQILNFKMDGSLKDDDLEQALSLYIPAMSTATLGGNTLIDLQAEIQEFLFNSEEKVLLLQGESGAGKSLFGRSVERALWDQKKDIENTKDFIPIFIDLKNMEAPVGGLIDQAFLNLKFLKEEISDLKKNYHFLFILDGYDEIRSRENFYDSNQLRDWKAKVMIACRSEYLLGKKENYQARFAPSEGGEIKASQLRERYMAPFSAGQIDDYLKKYVNLGKPLWSDWTEYRKYIDLIPGLEQLMVSPFLLRITVEVLPEIVRLNAHQQAFAQLTRYALYEAFCKRWFERQILKQKDRPDIEDLYDFSQRLATKMAEENVSAVFYDKRNKNIVKKWQAFFDDHPEVMNKRLTLPLKKEWVGENLNASVTSPASSSLPAQGHYVYSFLHKSLLEFFYSREIFEQSSIFEAPLLQASETAYLPNSLPLAEVRKSPLEESALSAAATALQDRLNIKLLNDEPSVIGFLVDKLKKDKDFQEILWELIEASKINANASIAAANAATILNAARIPFSGRYLNHIKIPGADLKESICDHTQFEGADLRNVNFTGSWMRQANLLKSSVEGALWGKPAYLETEGGFGLFSYSPDGTVLAASDTRGDKQPNIISLFNTITHERLNLEGEIEGEITQLLFSPNSLYLAIGSKIETSSESLHLYNVKSGRLFYTSKNNSSYDYSTPRVAFSPNSQLLAFQLGSRANGNCLGFNLFFMRNKDQIDLKNPPIDSQDATIVFYRHSPNEERFAVGYTAHFMFKGKWLEDKDGLVRGTYLAFGGLGEIKEGLTNITDENREEYSYLIKQFTKNAHLNLSVIDTSSLKIAALLQLPNKGYGDYTEKLVVKKIIFSPDEKHLAILADYSAYVYHIDSGNLVFNLTTEDNHRVYRIQFTPQGHLFALTDESLLVLEANSWNLLQKISPEQEVQAFTFYANGGMLAALGESNRNDGLNIWQVESGKRVHTQEIKLSRGSDIIASPDNQCLAAITGSDQNNIVFWDAATYKVVHIIKESSKITSIKFSSNGRNLAYLCKQKIKFFEINPEILYAGPSYEGHLDAVMSLDTTLNRQYLVTASVGVIYLWDLISRKRVCHFEAEGMHDIRKVVLSPNGEYLAAITPEYGGYQNSFQLGVNVKLWEISSKKLVHCFKWRTQGKYIRDLDCYTEASATDIQFSADSQYLAVSMDEGETAVEVLALSSCTPSFSIPRNKSDALYSIAYSPDNQLLALGLELYDLKTKNLLHCFEHDRDEVKKVSFSPDGKYFAAFLKNEICVWELASRKRLTVFKSHRDAIQDMAFSQDGQYLASVGSDKTIRIWDIARGKCSALVKGPSEVINAIRWFREGEHHYLSTADNRGAIQFWKVISSGQALTVLLEWRIQKPILNTSGLLAEDKLLNELVLKEEPKYELQSIISQETAMEQYHLGLFYEYNLGNNKQLNKALEFYSLAAAAHHEEAEADRDRCEKERSAPEQAKALEWYRNGVANKQRVGVNINTTSEKSFSSVNPLPEEEQAKKHKLAHV